MTLWDRDESSGWVSMIVLGIASIVNVPGLAAAAMLHAIAPESLVPDSGANESPAIQIKMTP